MANELGPIEIDCDAPPYNVVRASHTVGVRDPEDVRWCRMSQLPSPRFLWRNLLRVHSWKALLGFASQGEKTCFCGGTLPTLEKCIFNFKSGSEASYLLGQCSRCRTVFWEKAP